MQILLDECVPRPLRSEFAGHKISTVGEEGWAGKKNGELLALMAAAGFEVLLTVDQNLRYQQNLAASSVAVVRAIAWPISFRLSRGSRPHFRLFERATSLRLASNRDDRLIRGVRDAQI